MGIRLYATTGVYPNLSKTGDVLFETSPETITPNTQKNVETDEIPAMFLPEAWDSFFQTRTITITGSLDHERSSDSILTQYKKLDKLSFYYLTSDWVEQPTYTNIDSMVPLALEIDFIDQSGAVEVLTKYVVIDKMSFPYNPGAPKLNYNISFKEVQSVWSV